jgi:hypothetical protein
MDTFLFILDHYKGSLHQICMSQYALLQQLHLSYTLLTGYTLSTLRCVSCTLRYVIYTLRYATGYDTLSPRYNTFLACYDTLPPRYDMPFFFTWIVSCKLLWRRSTHWGMRGDTISWYVSFKYHNICDLVLTLFAE